MTTTPLNTLATASALANLRKSYERAELNESASHAQPLQQFQQWLEEAINAQVPEPNAMTLATVGSDLRPSTRVVLIKDCDARGIVWYTNYASRKGHELAGNPFAALQFHWVELERVVRIEGVVERVSDEESDAYFKSRPPKAGRLDCPVRPISLYTTPLSHKLPRELDACGEVDDALHTQPDGFDTRLPVPLTRQKASQAGH